MKKYIYAGFSYTLLDQVDKNTLRLRSDRDDFTILVAKNSPFLKIVEQKEESNCTTIKRNDITTTVCRRVK